jgi:hypothetical protein
MVDSIAIGNAPTGYPADVKDLAVDRSGRWLFVATDYSDGDVRVFDTGRMDPVRPARLGNISTRMRVLTDENVLIGGFIISGSEPKRVIVRGIGPSLSQIIPDSLADPMLELYEGGTLLVSNDNWRSNQQTEIEATGLAPSNDLESAIVRTLSPGAYTAIMQGTNSNVGTGLVEVYDLDRSSDSQFGNISTRGLVDTGDNVMIGGIIVPPTYASIRVIVRAIGPSLEAIGVEGALQDPTLELHDASGATIASNDNWRISDTGGSQEAEIEATTLAPTDDRESALVRPLAPGNYTTIVRGKDNTTGVGLVEVYNLPNQFWTRFIFPGHPYDRNPDAVYPLITSGRLFSVCGFRDGRREGNFSNCYSYTRTNTGADHFRLFSEAPGCGSSSPARKSLNDKWQIISFVV